MALEITLRYKYSPTPEFGLGLNALNWGIEGIISRDDSIQFPAGGEIEQTLFLYCELFHIYSLFLEYDNTNKISSVL